MSEVITGSIYFLGKYRPLHVEDTALARVVIRLRHAAGSVEDPGLRAWLLERISQISRDMRHYQSVSADHCDRGVSLRRAPHDAWLDKITASLPECPGLNYHA